MGKLRQFSSIQFNLLVRQVNRISLIYRNNHFCNTVSGNTCDSGLKKCNHVNKLKDIQRSDDMIDSDVDISQLIWQMQCGKAAGYDDLCAEHFKFAQNK